jgi:hypothetical protein
MSRVCLPVLRGQTQSMFLTSVGLPSMLHE